MNLVYEGMLTDTYGPKIEFALIERQLLAVMNERDAEDPRSIPVRVMSKNSIMLKTQAIRLRAEWR